MREGTCSSLNRTCNDQECASQWSSLGLKRWEWWDLFPHKVIASVCHQQRLQNISPTVAAVDLALVRIRRRAAAFHSTLPATAEAQQVEAILGWQKNVRVFYLVMTSVLSTSTSDVWLRRRDGDDDAVHAGGSMWICSVSFRMCDHLYLGGSTSRKDSDLFGGTLATSKGPISYSTREMSLTQIDKFHLMFHLIYGFVFF